MTKLSHPAYLQKGIVKKQN